MSKPQNPLAELNSYTYSHTLIMCDGMKTADFLYENGQLFTENEDDPEHLYDTQSIELVNGEGEKSEGRYIVLFDGRRDANYYITSVVWETIFAPRGPKNESKFDQIETEGEMVIEEPFGVDFLEALVKGTRELEVDPSGIVFMLKTDFVGHKPDGNQHTINNIKPFTFVMIDLTSKMNAGGSVYNISLFGTSNGVTKLPHVSAIANGLTVRLKKDDTLVSAMASLEKSISIKYNDFKDLVRKNLFDALADVQSFEQADVQLNERYIDVVYNIKLANEYTSSEYKIGGNEEDNIFDDGGEFVLKFSERASVEDCIKKLMNTCDLVNKESTEDKNIRSSYTPKISTELVPPDINGTYQVNYTIYRYQTKYQPVGEPFKPKEGQFIEFDYIYTGKNIDILDFDIKMDMGLSFFQTQLSPKSYASNQKETKEGNGNTEVNVASDTGEQYSLDPSIGSTALPAKRQAPLFLGATVNPASFNPKPKQTEQVSFDQAMSRQAALESIQGRVKILGNPQLLNESLKSTHRDRNKTDLSAAQLDEQDNVEDDKSTGLSEPFKRPGYVKINIRFPTTKDLAGTKKFWYDGFYSIFSIENNFSDGSFTQTLDLFSLPVSSGVPRKMATQKNTPLSQIRPPDNFKPLEDGTIDAQTNNRDYTIKVIPAGISEEDLLTGIGGEVDLWYKPDAKIEDIDIRVQNIFDDIIDIWKKYFDGKITPVITSGNDSKHSKNSLHYKNLAIDVRGNNLDPDKGRNYIMGRRMRQDIAIRLGPDFDVLYEEYPHPRSSADFFNTHFHIEYDPEPTNEGTVKHETVEEGENPQ